MSWKIDSENILVGFFWSESILNVSRRILKRKSRNRNIFPVTKIFLGLSLFWPKIVNSGSVSSKSSLVQFRARLPNYRLNPISECIGQVLGSEPTHNHSRTWHHRHAQLRGGQIASPQSKWWWGRTERGDAHWFWGEPDKFSRRLRRRKNNHIFPIINFLLYFQEQIFKKWTIRT